MIKVDQCEQVVSNPEAYTGESISTHLPVPAIGRAFDILNYIAGKKAPCSLREIYTALKLPKTSTFSILTTLHLCGVIVKLQNGSYVPSVRLYTLGTAVRIALEGNRFYLPLLEKLRDQSGRTVFLSLFDDGDLVVWEKVEGFESVYFKAYVGERKRLNTSSAGKAIAAYLAPEDLNYALAKGMDSFTDNSITDANLFKEQLHEIRRCGYALDDEESQLGIYCIGAPVFDNKGRVFGSISMSALKSEKLLEHIDEYIALVQQAAREATMLT